MCIFQNIELFLLSLYFIKLMYFSVDLWEFYLPYLYSCISLMGGLLLLSKPFHFFLYTLKKQTIISGVVLDYNHFNIAE